MEEKKEIKISLGTVICICIIVLLLMGMIFLFLKNTKLKNDVKQENENIALNERDENKNDDLAIEEANSNPNTYLKEGRYSVAFNKDNIPYVDEISRYIQFSKGKFTADVVGGFIIYGKYEEIGLQEIKCYIQNYKFIDVNNKSTTISLENEHWEIYFKVENDNKIEVEKCNVGDGAEISIALYQQFEPGNEFTIYKKEDFIGKWNSFKAKMKEENDGYVSWEETELASIFGNQYSQSGSTFEFRSDNTFKDYIYPMTENDLYRNGTYTFDGYNKFTLTYSDDSSKEAEVYIVNEDVILYKTEKVMILLKK